MNGLERASAVFCTACICTELLSCFVGNSWGRKCIKTVAGLYILVVLMDVLPGMKAQLRAWELPDTTAVPVGKIEDVILSQTERGLSQELEEQLLQETGSDVTLTVRLKQNTNTVSPENVCISTSQALSTEQKQAIETFLTGQLRLIPEQLIWEPPGGENAP